MKVLLLLLFPFWLFAQPKQTSALTLTPYCDGNGKYVRISGGSSPYTIKKIAGSDYTNDLLSLPGTDDILFQYAGPDEALTAGFDGTYLVKDAGGSTCANITPFKIWGNDSNMAQMEMTGVNFVQYDLSFVSGTIKENARVYMHGTHEYATGGDPGGTVGGASLVKTGTGDFVVEPNALITSACNTMWPGIVAHGEGEVVLTQNSQVQNAFTAIELPDEDGSILLNMEGCTLRNNFTGIRIAQIDLTNSGLTGCTFTADDTGLPPPFEGNVSNPVTSRFGINLVKGIGSTGSGSLTVQNCYFSNQLIGINTYGGSFNVDSCTFSKIRYKGISVDNFSYLAPLPSITNCTFLFDTLPHTGWARNTRDYCCGAQNKVPGQDSSVIAFMPNGIYGISSFVPLGQVSGNTFTSMYNTNYQYPQVGIIEPAASQVRQGNTFTNLDYGMVVPGGTASDSVPYSIRNNTFQSNSVSIYLDNGTFNLEMRCNKFETDENLNEDQRVGFHLADDAVLIGPIGNNGSGGNEDPSGNVWPVDAASSTTDWPVPDTSTLGVAIIDGWVSPANWTSLRNDNPNATLEYWAFDNEYVRDSSDNTPTNIVRRRIPPALQVIIHPEGTTPPSNSNYDYVELCSADLPDVFPLPLRPALPNANDVTAILSIIGNQTGQVALGDAVPNPAGTTTLIPVFVPTSHSGSVWLQVFDLTGRAVRWQTELKQTGSQWVEVSLSDFPAGVYGYALTDKGKAVGNRKLVVIR